ncbi:unnamed protein product [Caenorhabditis auriculariae]|uniref:Uncharacterized protein n=1 Tax=Caenorhabditis auriculariae TaxID=2777116 RepID=A0A8S1GT47_9PELO|nr:unnamed protein product [Caenorhabditis auriculariae]
MSGVVESEEKAQKLRRIRWSGRLGVDTKKRRKSEREGERSERRCSLCLAWWLLKNLYDYRRGRGQTQLFSPRNTCRMGCRSKLLQLLQLIVASTERDEVSASRGAGEI